MKTKTKVTEITHKDLVNILSTATYGSSWLSLSYDHDEYNNLNESQKHGDCIEDKCADLLLAGKTIYLYDCYAVSKHDYDGNLPREYDIVNERMRYTVSLQDITNGIEKCFDGSPWQRECTTDLIINDGCNLDLDRAATIAQVIFLGQQ